mgnify:CR=1 FL=1
MSNNNERPSRRLALLGDRPGSYAIARHVRMSPTKVRRVVDLVRGMDVKDALSTLKFAPQAASEPVYKVIASAVANAENTDALRADDPLGLSRAEFDAAISPLVEKIETTLDELLHQANLRANAVDTVFFTGGASGVPLLRVLDQAFGIEYVQITTIHSAMNDQPVIDAYHHEDLRRTRSAFQSVIPVSTGLARGIERLLPELSGRIQAKAIRVPTVNVSCLDITLQMARDTSAAEINQLLRAAAESGPHEALETRAVARLLHVARDARIAREVAVDPALRGGALDLQRLGEAVRAHAVDQAEVDRLGAAALVGADLLQRHAEAGGEARQVLDEDPLGLAVPAIGDDLDQPGGRLQHQRCARFGHRHDAGLEENRRYAHRVRA